VAGRAVGLEPVLVPALGLELGLPQHKQRTGALQLG